MQFMGLPKPIVIAERVLPELVLDRMNTWSVQNIDIGLIKKVQVNLLISWVIELLRTGMPHWRTIRIDIYQAWAIWDWSNHAMISIICDPCLRKRLTLSVESISTMPFHAATSYVKIQESGQRSSNHRMPCLVSIFAIFQETEDWPNENPAVLFMCLVDIFLNIANSEIQWPDLLLTGKIDQVTLAGCLDDWHNRRLGRNSTLHIPPPITHFHVTVYSAISRMCKVHQFNIMVHLKRKMCQKEPETFENVPVV